MYKEGKSIPGELAHLKNDKNPIKESIVIFKISIINDIYHFEMNEDVFNSFSCYENEVLLQDGMYFEITLIENE